MTSFRFTIGLSAVLFCVVISSLSFAGDIPAWAMDEAHVKLPGFGISFSAPDGWHRSPEVTYSQLARFALVKDRKVVGFLEVDAAPGAGLSAKEVADKLAKDRGGEVVAGNAAGATRKGAVEVQLAPSNDFPAILAAVMPVREQIVVFTVGDVDAHTAQSILHAVLATMIVSNPKPASEDLELRKRPIPLFDSAVLILLPEPFRPDKVKKPEAEAFYGARDWSSGRDEASIHMQVTANPRRVDLGAVAETTAKALTTKLKPADPITVEKLNDNPPTYVSKAFAMKANEEERIVYMAMDASRFAVIIFRTTAPDSSVRDKYMALVEEVARTAKVSATYQPATRSAGSPAGKP
jgi:hypothetical protein